MDPGLAALAAGPAPGSADAHVLVLPGAYLPILLPLGCLTPEHRVVLLDACADAPIAPRVQAALDAGDTARAWGLVARVRKPLTVPTGLDGVLNLWGAAELARLQLTPGRDPVLLLGGAQALQDLPKDALADVQAMLDPWPWPRWIGQVVLVAGEGASAGLPAGQDLLVRPVVPVMRVPATATRGALAQRMCRLILQLSAPPERGWPAWLLLGLESLARARGDFQVVSPDRMAALRAGLGGAGIRAALAATAPDEQTATALVCMLNHPSRRAALPSLLDLLRTGASSEQALRIAYQLTPELMATSR